MSRGVSGDQTTRSGMEQVKSGRQRDVLLGVGKVPLVKLLAHKTGWSTQFHFLATFEYNSKLVFIVVI